MLSVARDKWSDLKGVTFQEGDAQNLPFSDRYFDVVSVAYGARNWPALEVGLAEAKRVLRVGGQIGILEFGQPRNAVWRGVFNAYSRYVIPVIGGMVSGERAPYEYLPKTAATFPSGERFEEIMSRVGLASVRTVPLMNGIAYLYIGERRYE
jgi:demethylmenaquinone methyltransferase/2-methoxy-6-polyprenyl-1,4-benzoquinol methylase